MRTIFYFILLFAWLNVVCFHLPAVAEDSNSDAEFIAPASWSEYLDNTIVLGTWVGHGKTEEMWVGIPAGVEYTSTEKLEIGDEGSEIQQQHLMKTKDGKVFSTGGGRFFWDDESDQVKITVYGLDNGSDFFSGTSTLIGIDKANGKERWKHIETSRGVTTEYIIERSAKTQNERSMRWQKAEGGKPWTIHKTRLNRLAEVTDVFDMTGTWEMKLPTGDSMIIKGTLGLDGRALFAEEIQRKADGTSEKNGTFVMCWDPVNETVAFHGLGANGLRWQSEMLSLTTDNDEVTMVTRFQGAMDGNHASGIMTRVIKGDKMTQKFSDVKMANRKDTPGWAKFAPVFTRVSD
ncbi:MAG: hypothetical protein P8N76_26100 [Pirellulaceae bacterium]|nr:hypothetical protein [Pirellulaceae bacterium]